MNGLDNLVPFAPSQRSTIAFVPINQLTDTMNWTGGNHTFEFGTDLFLIRDNQHHSCHAINNYEFYGQDSWRMTLRLTVTYGLRWVLEAPPYEINGLQVAPCVEAASGGCSNQNVTDYFNHSAQLAAQGMPANNAGEITFVPGGPVNKGPGLWNWDRKNRGGPDRWRSLHATPKNQKIPKMLALLHDGLDFAGRQLPGWSRSYKPSNVGFRRRTNAILEDKDTYLQSLEDPDPGSRIAAA